MSKVVETDRLFLWPSDENFAPMVLDFYVRNREHLKQWEPEKDDAFYTLERQINDLAIAASEQREGRALRLWMFKKDEPRRIIGSVSFGNVVFGAFLSCFLGYKLDKDETGCGYMAEAVKRGIGLMFGEWGLHRIEANIMPKNRRSLAVVQRLGFENEGLSPKYLRINGSWEDHIHMVLRNTNMEAQT
jgi:ribosomal-protein-alanine N-acetyltransferase